MGDGVFLAALAQESDRRRLRAEVWGVELAADTYALTVANGLVRSERALRSDFLAVTPFEVDAVVGNPPYVRLRHLPAAEAARARQVGDSVLQPVVGSPLDPSGSVWMPFVLHASRFLARGGRLAMVLPYDVTYVRYARPLWRFLGESFGSLRVVRVRERMFPDILQEAVLLFADDFGGRTAHVAFEAYETLAHLADGSPDVQVSLRIDDVVGGDRVFLEALLPSSVQELLRGPLRAATMAASELVTFRIGYVCGDKEFFHPSAEEVRRFRLPERHLLPALTSARQLSGVGVRTSSLPAARGEQLWLPTASLGAGEQRYVQHGEGSGVSQRFKCRIRDPWYVTPGVKVPDVVVPVFTERPTLMVNDAGMVATNSLLCGYLRPGVSADAVACSWYTSLTLLQMELEVHALGGGVMVLVPREGARLRLLPPPRTGVRQRLDRVGRLLRDGDVEAAFTVGDDALVRVLPGGAADLAALSEATATLVRWRRERGQ